jgi:hypothetical protein
MVDGKLQIPSILGETDKSEEIISAFYRAFTYNFPSFPIKQQWYRFHLASISLLLTLKFV